MVFLEALRFLTIIPISRRRIPQGTELASSLAYFPLVGALLGSILALMDMLLSHSWSNSLVAAFTVVALVILTGGLHLDGLADTIDGLLGGRSRGEKLRIMEGSTIGTFGALALLCTLLLKFALLMELPDPLRRKALFIVPMLGRWAMVYGAFVSPAAKERGMGSVFKTCDQKKGFALATITAVTLSLLFGVWGLALLVSIWLATALLSQAIARQLGGLTGDTYGALCEIDEVLGLGLFNLLAGFV